MVARRSPVTAKEGASQPTLSQRLQQQLLHLRAARGWSRERRGAHLERPHTRDAPRTHRAIRGHHVRLVTRAHVRRWHCA
jgi:hypothetical protein